MAKKLEISNYRVEVTPYQSPYISTPLDPERARRMCEEMERAIRHHLQGPCSCDNFGDASVECDREYVCEHCGYPWGDLKSDYNGGCCDEDEKNNPEERNNHVAEPLQSVVNAFTGVKG